ncbi:MAG: mechanosensitive ion channel [Candidatus Marinimicrobia bacterium]|nr:mechanosensitive ion channel [Candidatus Neomarinimicrobiota bacterium]
MRTFFDSITISQETLQKIIFSVIIFVVLTGLKILSNLIIRKRITDSAKAYKWNRAIFYIYALLLIMVIGSAWIKGMKSITTFLGLASAGIAIAMHDTIANIAGWFHIITRQPFKIGNRIEIDNRIGDVIDIRILQFSMVECGNWVDADQSTGRIIHIPNSKVLREPLANYEIGFKYIWNEIPVLVTFESDWTKAKEILTHIADKNVLHLSKGAEQQIRRAAKKYLIIYKKLTPIVYVSVKESGVLLTLRYLVNPRERRNSENKIWETILNEFKIDPSINLAYPTYRIYTEEKPNK